MSFSNYIYCIWLCKSWTHQDTQKKPWMVDKCYIIQHCYQIAAYICHYLGIRKPCFLADISYQCNTFPLHRLLHNICCICCTVMNTIPLWFCISQDPYIWFRYNDEQSSVDISTAILWVLYMLLAFANSCFKHPG